MSVHRKTINVFDYRNLLKKYMKRVLNNEGITFVNGGMFAPKDMTWQEQQLLVEIEKEVNEEQPKKIKAVWG